MAIRPFRLVGCGTVLLAIAGVPSVVPSTAPPRVEALLRWRVGSDVASPATRDAQIRARPAQGTFLVAGRELRDPHFSQTVVLLIEYGPDGAVGMIINRPTGVTLAAVLPDLKTARTRPDTVYIGGPVGTGDMRLLVEAETAPEESSLVIGNIYLSGSVELLRRLASSPDGMTRFRVYSGYAGWAPAQLDLEILRGDWHVLPADAAMVFETPWEEIWPVLIDRTTHQVVDGEAPTFHAPWRTG